MSNYIEKRFEEFLIMNNFEKDKSRIFTALYSVCTKRKVSFYTKWKTRILVPFTGDNQWYP